jgi:hypothetical protein
VVDMGDDGDVAYVGLLHGSSDDSRRVGRRT